MKLKTRCYLYMAAAWVLGAWRLSIMIPETQAMIVPAPIYPSDFDEETVDTGEQEDSFDLIESNLELPTEGEITGTDLELVSQWPKVKEKTKKRHN